MRCDNCNRTSRFLKPIPCDLGKMDVCEICERNLFNRLKEVDRHIFKRRVPKRRQQLDEWIQQGADYKFRQPVEETWIERVSLWIMDRVSRSIDRW